MTQFRLYEVVHVRRGRPRLVAEHATALGTASQALFRRPYNPDIGQLTARITALTKAERYPADVSGFVRLELTPDGAEQLSPAGISLYDGYALRSLSPDAKTVEYDLPQLLVRSSAHEAATTLANLHAGAEGCAIAVRCNRDGILTEADDAPLFAIRDREILSSPAPFTPIQTLVLKAARTIGLKRADRPVTADELASCHELFYADHRGVTALAHCNGYPFMSLTAERIAAAMEEIVR